VDEESHLRVRRLDSHGNRLPGVQQQLTNALRSAILSGEYPRGSRLPQVEVAEAFGVSPVPLREALVALGREGLVVRQPRRGWFVVRLEENDIREIYELRSLLEEKALRDAFPRLTDEDRTTLEELTSKLRDTSDPFEHFELRERFYSTLYGASGKPRMVSIILNLHNQLAMHLRLQRVHDSNHAHDELMATIRSGDVERACALVRLHLTEICARSIEGLPQAAAAPDVIPDAG
jgi:DNA-binding GntR family transcriptional regulator